MASRFSWNGIIVFKEKNFKYLLCVIDVFTKYAWVKPVKDEKCKKVLNAFIEIVNESNLKPSKLWVDQGWELYNKHIQEWLDNNDVLIYLTHNKGKSVITGKFIKTLKAKICNKTAANNDSKCYLSCSNKSVVKYNNTYHYSINKKPINADYSWLTEKTGTNPKVPKFKVNDRVRITKYENNFSEGYTKNWSREIFIIYSVLKTNPWTYKIKD